MMKIKDKQRTPDFNVGYEKPLLDVDRYLRTKN
jgi:hypothetical protein